MSGSTELHAHGVADEQSRFGADQHLACRRRLFEAGCHVDGIPGDERLALAADDDLARVDADSGLEPVDRHRLPHLPRRAHRAQRVVLVRNGNAEDSHHRVADELLDRAAVPLEDRAEVREVAAHARPKRLGIGRLAERGRSDEVAEENGDDLARLALRRGDAPARRRTRCRIVRHPHYRDDS